MKIIIRNITKKDIRIAHKIYNYYIFNSFVNFEEKPISLFRFKNMVNKILLTKLPFIVSELNGQVVGLAYLTKYRNKSGYKFSYENSIYIDNNYVGKGIGQKLLKNLLKISKKNNKIKNIVAIIGDSKNYSSIKIHKKSGFNHVGILKKIGFKKNKWIDSLIMLKKI